MRAGQAERTDIPAGSEKPAGMLFPCLWANMWSEPEPKKADGQVSSEKARRFGKIRNFQSKLRGGVFLLSGCYDAYKEKAIPNFLITLPRGTGYLKALLVWCVTEGGDAPWQNAGPTAKAASASEGTVAGKGDIRQGVTQ